MTAWPAVDGSGVSEVMVVVVDAVFTCCVRTADVLVVKLPEPLYTAVMLCGFTVRAAVANVATPLAFTLVVPSVPAPSLNVTSASVHGAADQGRDGRRERDGLAEDGWVGR